MEERPQVHDTAVGGLARAWSTRPRRLRQC